MAEGKKIRTVQVAKHLGITPRDLREKVLAKVNFPGIKSTDREIPFSVASGIVRVASRMLKISCPPLEEEEGISGSSDESADTNVSVVETRVELPKKFKRSNLSTLEKLRGIGERSQSDIENLKIKKEEEEKKRQEQKAQREKEEQERKKAKEGRFERNSGGAGKNDGKDKKGGTQNIMRKIEISKEDAEEAKRKREEREMERQRRKEQEEQSLLERKLLRKKRQEQIFTKKEGTVELSAQLSVKEFSEKIGVPSNMVIASLVKNGVMATVNQQIDFDTASIIAEELEIKVKKVQDTASSEDILKGDLSALLEDDPSKLKARPPVVAVVGHVDHGKTSILDAVRKTKVVAGESGGITQHIGAYSIQKDGRDITFLDTPGHEAFTSMRARGAKTADVVILVVAADDGVMPQTKEAINHAKAAGVAIIVAANKIDKETANLDKLKADLAEHGIQVEDWGGNVPLVPVSALTGQGIPDLLEMVFLQSDVMELKANPKRLAVGTVIEAHRDPGLGPVATILINTGTMNVRDRFVLGSTWGRVKMIVDEDGKKLKTVPPSGAARISGIDDLPEPGDIFQVLGSEKELRQKKQELEQLQYSEKKHGMGMSDIIQNIKSGDMKTLNLVVKADTIGSLEAIEQSLGQVGNQEVSAKIIHSAAGSVSENDIMMASASNGFVIAFYSTVPSSVRQFAEKEGVEIESYEIIYDLIDQIENILEGMLEPEVIETITGKLDVKGVFYTKGKRKIVGGKVSSGYFEHPCQIKIYRGTECLGDAKLTGIQHFEDKVKRIESPQECGLNIEGFLDEIQEGDRLEGVIQETVMRKLSDVKSGD